jgi:hypothetical protein
MALLIFVAIVILVLVLVLWAIYYLPMPPSPPYMKNFLMALVFIVAAIVIAARALGHL